MSRDDLLRWEQTHAGRAGAALAAPAASILWIPPARPGALALDLACGRGRHCRSLLDAGYSVVAADISRIALREVACLDRYGTARLWPVQVDLDRWPFADDAFDLIVQVDYLERRLFDSLRRGVRAGGSVLIDTFRQGDDHASGPRNPAYRLRPGELEELFAGWEILRNEVSEENGPRQALLARRPDGPQSSTPLL